MNLSVTIRSAAEHVSICRGRQVAWLRLSAQWTELYCRLAFARETEHEWVTAPHLQELRSWRGMRPQNVGKAVARHLSDLKNRKACVIESDSPTVRWKLAGSVRTVVDLRDEDGSLHQWLTDRGMGNLRSTVNPQWLTASVQALLAYGCGKLVDAERHAWTALKTDGINADCRRVAGMMVLRTAAARNRSVLVRDAVERILDRGSESSSRDRWGQGALGDYFRARLSALEAIDSGPQDADGQLSSIRRKLERADRGGNLSTQVMLMNTLGLLCSRCRRYAEARHHLTGSIVLALAIGDVFSLGGAILNLAITELRDGRSSAEARPFVELCVEIDKTAFVGRSSAQAEILLARVLIEGRNFDDATAVLMSVESMVKESGSSYDAGCFNVALAKLLWAQPPSPVESRNSRLHRIERLLSDASEYFRTSGRESDYVDAQLSALRRGEGLSLSCLA